LSAIKRELSVNQVFAYRLRDARLSKRWTQQDLADAMERIGYPIGRATIAKIESFAHGVGGEIYAEPIRSGQTKPRPVSLAEAIAFAVALDVAPTNLYLPITDQDDVKLTEGKPVDAATARAWARGEKSLEEDDRFYRLQAPYEPPKATAEDLKAMNIDVREQKGDGPDLGAFLGVDLPNRKDQR
jgi:transcriptional regulator with XRE-family HTH domain